MKRLLFALAVAAPAFCATAQQAAHTGMYPPAMLIMFEMLRLFIWQRFGMRLPKWW